jgi:hypothetical protein
MPVSLPNFTVVGLHAGLEGRATVRWPRFLLFCGLFLIVDANRTAQAGGYIFWIDNSPNNSIFRSALDGSDIVEIVPNASGTHIAADLVGKKIYWSDGDYLRRSSFDGTSAEIFLHDLAAAQSFHGLAFDPADSGTLFYVLASGTIGEVSRIDTDGTGYRKLLGGGHWFDLGLRPADDMMLLSTRFVSGNDPRIFRAGQDGSWLSPNAFPTTGSHARITVHESSDLLYWTGSSPSGADATWRSSIDGTNADVVLGRVEDLQVFGDKLYYAQLGSPSRTDIWRSDLDGSMPELVALGMGNITAFVVIPEPATLSLLSLLGAFAIRRDRPRRHPRSAAESCSGRGVLECS